MKFTWVCLFSLILLACSSGPISLNIPDTKAEKPADSRMEIVEQRECGFQLLDFIPAGTNDTLSRGLRALRYRTSGTYVEEVAVDQTWYYGLIGTILCTTVSAKIYR